MSVAKLPVPEAPAGRARAYACVAIVLAGIACAGVVAANVSVNPRAEFPTTGLRPLVVDRVHLRVQTYVDAAHPPEDLVLGASRADFVAGLPGRENVSANFAVAGSTPEDWRDLYTFVRSRQGPPRSVVLVIDQSVFTDVFSPRVPKSHDAGRVLGKPVSPAWLASTAVQTLSVDYAGDTLHSLRLRYITGYPPPPFATADPAFSRADLLQAYRNGTFDPAKVHPEVEEQSRKAFGPDGRVSPDRREALDELLGIATADGVEVWAIIAPYQPVALVDLQERYPALLQRTQEVREALQAWCGKVHAADATNATLLGIDPGQFFDQSHPTAEGAAQMMAAVTSGRGDLCGGG